MMMMYSEWELTQPRHKPGEVLPGMQPGRKITVEGRCQVDPPSPLLSPSQDPSEPQLTAGSWTFCMAEERTSLVGCR